MLLVVTVTKFTHGAWLVFAIGPVLFFLMLGVNRYYKGVERDIEVDQTTRFGADGDHAVVLVGRMQKPTLKALDYAIAARHETIEAHCSIDDDETELLEEQWTAMNISVPLRSPVAVPGHQFPADQIHQEAACGVRLRGGHGVHAAVHRRSLVGEPAHNHKARRIRRKLLLCHGVTVALVPWLLDSSSRLWAQPKRPLPGQDRRGEPVRRAVVRKPLPPAVPVAEPAPSATRASDTKPVDRQPAGKQ